MSKTVQVDTKTFIRFWLVVAVLGAIVLLLGQALQGLIIVGLSIFLALAVRPLVARINRFFGGDNPALSAGITVGALVIIIGIVIAVVGPVLVSETSNFLKSAPEMMQNGGTWDFINDLGSKVGISDAKGQVISAVQSFAQGLVSNLSSFFVTSVSAISTFLTGLILTIVLAVLWLVQGPGLMSSLWKKIDSKDGSVGKVAKRVTSKMADVISKYVYGQASVAVLDGVVSGLIVFVLTLIFGLSPGLALPMGLIAMIFYLIPMFGPFISCVLISLVLFFSSPLAALCYLAVYLIYSQIENNIIAPKVQGNALDLPSLIILIAITIGMYMFGLLGAIISIPIAGMIKVLIDEYPAIRALKDKD